MSFDSVQMLAKDLTYVYECDGLEKLCCQECDNLPIDPREIQQDGKDGLVCEKCINSDDPAMYVVPSTLVIDLIDAQIVYCKHRSQGCKVEMKRNEFVAHVLSCKYAIIGCRQMILTDQAERIECRHGPVTASTAVVGHRHCSNAAVGCKYIPATLNNETWHKKRCIYTIMKPLITSYEKRLTDLQDRLARLESMNVD